MRGAPTWKPAGVLSPLLHYSAIYCEFSRCPLWLESHLCLHNHSLCCFSVFKSETSFSFSVCMRGDGLETVMVWKHSFPTGIFVFYLVAQFSNWNIWFLSGGTTLGSSGNLRKWCMLGENEHMSQMLLVLSPSPPSSHLSWSVVLALATPCCHHIPLNLSRMSKQGQTALNCEHKWTFPHLSWFCEWFGPSDGEIRVATLSQ